MHQQKLRHSLVSSGEIAGYAAMLVVAAAIAWYLPAAIQGFLSRGWPWITSHPQVLMALQIGVAAMLMTLFVTIKNSLRFMDSARLTSLVHASRREGDMTPQLLHKLPSIQQACVMTVTGHDTFGDPESQFRRVLEEVREVRVMLLNPLSEGARLRADSLSGDRDYYGKMLADMHDTIEILHQLRSQGKRVMLKFYDHQPFWKLVIVGGYVWVQYCQDGVEVSAVPEYVFAQPADNSRPGLYTPFNRLFEEKWTALPTVEFDFDTQELVKRDAAGNTLERMAMPHSPHARKHLAIARNSQCALTGYVPNQA